MLSVSSNGINIKERRTTLHGLNLTPHKSIYFILRGKNSQYFGQKLALNRYGTSTSHQYTNDSEDKRFPRGEGGEGG